MLVRRTSHPTLNKLLQKSSGNVERLQNKPFTDVPDIVCLENFRGLPDNT